MKMPQAAQQHSTCDRVAASAFARIVVAQLGARRHYGIPHVLAEAGALELLYTDVCSSSGWPRLAKRLLGRCAVPAPVRRLIGREVAEVDPSIIRQFPLFGVRRAVKSLLVRSSARARLNQLQANIGFGRRVARRGFGAATAVYTFNGAAFEILKEARRLGLTTILDQTSAPVGFEEQIKSEERLRWPGWEVGGTPRAVWETCARREQDEWGLADLIISGSSHVSSLVKSEVNDDVRIATIPYGTDSSRFSPRVRRGSAPLKVLFVGNVRLLKGVQYLAEAARLIGSGTCEFRVAGSVKVDRTGLACLQQSLNLLGPIPRASVAREYDSADVLVLPTLSEGSAAVCYEALASGVPVITTPNAGSVVRNGIEGFIVPIRNSEILAERISQLAGDRALLEEMSAAAIARSHEFSIMNYGSRLLQTLEQTSGGH